MNAPQNFPAVEREPTLADRLRVIDLTFECVRRASDIVSETHPHLPRTFAIDERDGPSERSRRIGKLSLQLRRNAMVREGLPLSLLGDGLTSEQRHFAKLDELTAEPQSHLRVTAGMGA